MTVDEVRRRVAWQSNHYIPAVRDAVMDDFNDDIRLMHARRLTPLDICEKWSNYIGLKIKK